MKTLFLSSKLVCKNVFLVISYCLFFGYINYEFIRIFKGVSAYNQTAFVFLSETLNSSIFCTVFFLFFSYLLFAKAKKANLDECLAATKSGRQKLLLGQFTTIVLLILLIAVTAILYNLAYPNTDTGNAQYIVHMLCCVLTYLFLVPMLGALIGMCASLLFKQLTAYLVMILFVLLSSPLAGMIAFMISEATQYQVNISRLFDIFHLYPLNLDYAPIYSFGISLLPYKFEAILFWGFAVLAIVIYKQSKQSQLALRVISFVCALISLVNVIAFFQPASSVDMSYRVDGTLLADEAFYYSLYDGEYPKEEEKPAQFQVLKYDLDIHVKKQLYVTAKLKVDKTDLPVYGFTLYHNYKITKVTNQDNVSLPFKQDVDYVEIYNDASLSEIVFTYSGYNSRFYSNPQGVFLPGYFAYYPIAGQRNLFASDWQGYTKNLLPNEAEFHVTIDAPKEIFTNLNADKAGGYSGKTNGLTIMSGFFKSTVISGIEVIYPYFNTEEFNTAQLKQDLEQFLEVKKDDVVKKIFVVPGVNQKSDSIVAYSDYVTTEQIMALPERYVLTKILDQKHTLYTYQDSYLNDKSTFDAIVEGETNYPPEYDRIATLYQEKIALLGEKTVVEQTNTYLFDSKDTRSITQFLKELS